MERNFLITWVFPGQGSQSVGMGAGEALPTVETWETARDVLGWDLRSVCLHGPAELLASTSVAQPAILTGSVAAARALESTGLIPDLVAGHSVGELAALVVARALTFEDALRVVTVRAGAMARAGEDRPGSMTALIGMPAERVAAICSETPGIVVVANVNTADQIVISGEEDAVRIAGESARAAGCRRVIPLAVSVAAHSPLMSPAAEELERALASVTLLEPVIPFASCISGRFLSAPDEIKRELVRAMTDPVDWPGCVQALRTAGTDLFVEVGPGRVLSGLVRRIASDARISSVADETEAIALAHDLAAGVTG
jgi:[acyl-carrier-protein] S-malonyltransferase